jgi:hypothetical protein
MTTETNPFVETTIDETPSEVTLAHYMGEGKKYRDEAAVARAISEKDSFIARLQRENEGLRNELNSKTTLEEFMTRMEAKKDLGLSNGGDTLRQEPVTETVGLTQEDINRILEEKLGSMTAAQVKAANLQASLDLINTVWGGNAQIELNKKAQELGVKVDDLREQAEKNPKLFAAMVGLNTAQQSAPRGPTANVDASKFQPTTTDKNYAYYKRLQKESPSTYWTPAVQNQMHKDAIALGDRFYN